MRELAVCLNEAARFYYDEDREIMPNIEYDRLYGELAGLEKETGVVLSGSPTARVGYETLSELPREVHESPMLSLDKTKEITELADWLGDKKGLLSWKLDGLTIALTYRGGLLFKAVTRGNGQIGEVITGNARSFVNLPHKIPFEGELVVRGEAVIRYSDFEKINEALGADAVKYKNPRNLSSGSVRQLNSRVTAARRVRFYAFSLVKAEGAEFQNSREEQMKFLKSLGFETVTYFPVRGDGLAERVIWFENEAAANRLPSDGLVLIYDDIAYGVSLGRTSKFPRDAVAFKWKDELRETTLREIEWNTSRTGLINPVAVFDAVELGGTTVSRASVHNISILEELALGAGDIVTVYKANMIIPQIADNLTRSGPGSMPRSCRVCGGRAEIRDNSGVKFLYCTNEDCLARKIKAFTHFTSRNAMNIEGLSEATLEKFIAKGLIREFSDIFRLAEHREEIVKMEGFGEKSFANLIEAIDRARNATQIRLLYGLGIPNIGLANAKLICRACAYDWRRVQNIDKDTLAEIDGVGEVMAEAYEAYFADEKNRKLVAKLLREIIFRPMNEAIEEQ
ncbi:MAG: NAD-dependent DNA ligase LigA, partial [Clostridiales Family XIII bacterium]|nr:NAD-dependent DNA ligase LigA [Clostridiales Family XIII bacterium]